MAYALERREAVLKKKIPPNAMPIAALAKQENICEQTLYGWRTKARKEGRLMPDSYLTPEGSTSSDKFSAVLETATMSKAEIGEYCRQKGLHTSQLAAWRAACEQANDWDRATSTQIRSARNTTDKDSKKHELSLCAMSRHSRKRRSHRCCGKAECVLPNGRGQMTTLECGSRRLC